MKLRDYQEAAVASIWQYFATSDGNPLLALPTGTGKSVIIAEFFRRAFSQWPNQRMLMLTHIKELISQNHEKLIGLWPTAPAGIYSAGLNRRDLIHPIIFGGIASIARQAAALGKVDVIIIDECHLVSHNAETLYRTLINELLKVNPHLKVIGFSATPYRLGLGHLTDGGGIFTDVCYDLTGMDAFNKLVEDGWLAPLVTKKTYQELDVANVKTSGGEFIQKQLQEAVDRLSITEAAVQEMMWYGKDRHHWLVFAAGVEHSDHVAECLNLNGIPARSLHAGCSDEERKDILAQFKGGTLHAVVNNNILTTGFDFPGIDLIGCLRPTNSSVLWVQMLGRGTRPAEGKNNCLVLDFAGNTRRLGPINDPVLPRKKGEKGPGQAPVRLCDACGTYCHASVTVCPHCGQEFPRELKLATTAYTDAVMANSAPQVEPFTVNKVIYGVHKKIGRPPTLRVSYYCGLRLFREYICMQHEGYARRVAQSWWKERSFDEPPETVAEAARIADSLKVPKTIKVWINTKYPEIVSYEF